MPWSPFLANGVLKRRCANQNPSRQERGPVAHTARRYNTHAAPAKRFPHTLQHQIRRDNAARMRISAALCVADPRVSLSRRSIAKPDASFSARLHSLYDSASRRREPARVRPRPDGRTMVARRLQPLGPEPTHLSTLHAQLSRRSRRPRNPLNFLLSTLNSLGAAARPRNPLNFLLSMLNSLGAAARPRRGHRL
jgi:hypothetical protein